MATASVLMFLALNGIYEPSAIQQLPDGRFIIVEDEKEHPFSVATLRADGTTTTAPLLLDEAMKLADLEGIAGDSAGNVYAITSHSRNNAGEEKASREKLVRFRVEGNRLVSPVVVKGLKAALTAAHPVLAQAAEVGDVKADGGLNIEALEMSPNGQRLMIGLRSPLSEEHALIASIENPAEVFELGATPRIAARLITLDLEGHGLRGMAYIPVLSGYLLISGPVAREQVQFRLWFWSGRQEDRPRRVSVPGLAGFEHAEGVSPATIDGRPYIVIVSDDGSREEGRPARFLLLEPGQLQIAPVPPAP